MTPQRHPKQTASAISASHCFTLTQFDCCLHNPRFQFDIATLALISVPNDSQQVHLRLYATTHYLPNLSPPDRHQSYLQAVQASQAWPRRTLCPPLRPLRSVICRCGAITVYRDWIAAGCVVQRPVSILRVDNQNGCPLLSCKAPYPYLRATDSLQSDGMRENACKAVRGELVFGRPPNASSSFPQF
jgi:hypothetical protein